MGAQRALREEGAPTPPRGPPAEPWVAAEAAASGGLCGKPRGPGSRNRDVADRQAMAAPGGRVICIGDLHGNLTRAKALWRNLIETIGEHELSKAEVVFLGDFCDRGPDTKGVIDWLINLQQSREQHPGGTHFLCGNHDFGMAAFLGCLPCDKELLSTRSLDETKKAHFTHGFWPHPVPGGMHYQGRRWGGSRIYESSATFRSYGASLYEDIDDITHIGKRQALLDVVPESHKKFLSSLKWVVDIVVDFEPGRIVCVHAGLDSSKDAHAQIAALHNRDIWDPVLFEEGDRGRFAAMSGRKNVESMPPQLESSAILVSGHHGFAAADPEKGRVVMDRSGGRPAEPIWAFIFPDWGYVSSDRY